MNKKRYTIFFIVLITIIGSLFYLNKESNNKITIGIFAGSVWDVPNPDSYTIIDKAIENFKSINSNIEIEYVSGIQESDYSSWLAKKIVEGNEPDVYMILQSDFENLVSIGALEKLDSYIENDPNFNIEDYYLSPINNTNVNNSFYALPYLCNPTLMFVNTTLLQNKNIDIPDNDWTIDDFYNICKQTISFENRTFGSYNYSWLNIANSYGYQIFDENGYLDQHFTEDMNNVFLLAKKLRSLEGNYRVSVRDFDDGRVAFQPLSYAQYRTYKSYPYQVQKYSNFSWGCLSMPNSNNGNAISENSSILLGISSRSHNKKQAWNFLKYLSYDEEVQSELMQISEGISPLIKVSEKITTIINSENPNYVIDINLLNKVMNNPNCQNSFKDFKTIKEYIDNKCEELIKNDDDVYIFSNNLQKELKILLNE